MSKQTRQHRPNQNKSKPNPGVVYQDTYFYRIVFKAFTPDGRTHEDAVEMGLNMPLEHIGQFSSMQKAIADRVQVQNSDGGLLIGAGRARVLITSWAPLRMERRPVEAAPTAPAEPAKDNVVEGDFAKPPVDPDAGRAPQADPEPQPAA